MARTRALAAAGDADLRFVAAALRGAGALARDQGDLDQAQEHGEAALHMFEEGGDERGIAAMLINLGNVALDRGESAAAAERYAAALERSRALGRIRYTALALNNLGLAEAALGHGDAAAAHYEECLALAAGSANDHLRAMVLDNLGRLALWRSDLDRAETLHQESLDRRREMGNQRGIETSLRGLANVAFARNDRRRAAELHAESLTIAAELGDRDGAIADLERLAALIAGQAPETAARFLGASAGMRDAIGLDPIPDERERNEQTLHALGGALSATRVELARVAGREAPLPRLAAEARDATAALSSDPSPAPEPQGASTAGQSTADAGLSPRELEILRLVADRLPDREIAEVLFISPRTVGGHVTSILNKLGLNSRAAATAYAVRHGLT